MKLTWVGVLVSSLTACAGAPPPAEHPSSVAAEPKPNLNPEPAQVLAPAAPIIPPPPAKCDALRVAVPAAACPAEPLGGVESKLAAPVELLAWEACDGFEAGLLRALVAELSPMECADVIVEAAAGQGRALSAELRDVLAGLGIAARLARLAGDPPRLEPPFDKPRFKDFLTTRLAPWVVAQAKAIDDLSRSGAGLSDYGKGVVAIQAGLADLRMVELMRETSLPDEMAGDRELEDVYFGALDQSLDPRKQRGRDAALVGLRKFHAVGAIADARLDQAHRLLSLLYNGRRIDGLAGLMLPADTAPAAPAGQRLGSAVPTFYADKLGSAAQLRERVPTLSHHGLPVVLQQSVEGPAGEPLSPALQLSYALGLARMGQRYFSRADFERAGKLAEALRRSPKVSPAAKLLVALGKAFAGAPDDAAKMMISGLGKWQPDVAELDALAKGRDPVAGMAAFNAAFLLQLAAPQGSPPAYFADLSARYTHAAKLLSGDRKQRAEDLADAADDVAKAVKQ